MINNQRTESMMYSNYGWSPTPKFTRSVKDLLFLQSKGETLTKEEKDIVVKYANEQHKRKQSKTKK